MKRARIGIDFGGTKIEAAAIDGDGAFLARIRAATPAGYEEAIRTIRDLVAEVEAQASCAPQIGVGCPGSASPRTGLMRNANRVWLNGRAFARDLADALDRPVRVANDANCLALSEAVDGAGAGARVVFAIVIGTGCGGGLVVDRKLIEGANLVGGEWGHIPLPWPDETELPGPLCWCGRHNCLEGWVSGTGFERDFRDRTGRTLSAPDILAAARAGDPGASDALARYVHRLGRAIAVLGNIVDPDVIVLGGGLSNLAELYTLLPPIVAAHVFSDCWATRLSPARWGDSSGIRGAARLWTDSAAVAHV